MNQWTSDELARLGAADELEIAPLRPDGTRRKPVTIWVVRVGDELYVRSYRGRSSAWFRGALASFAARVWAGGVEKDVALEVVDDAATQGQIDAAYRAKYGRYGAGYVDTMISAAVRAATLRLVPAPDSVVA